MTMNDESSPQSLAARVRKNDLKARHDLAEAFDKNRKAAEELARLLKEYSQEKIDTWPKDMQAKQIKDGAKLMRVQIQHMRDSTARLSALSTSIGLMPFFGRVAKRMDTLLEKVDGKPKPLRRQPVL